MNVSIDNGPVSIRKASSIERIGKANSEWSKRPNDERYLSLEELANAVHARRKSSEQCDIATEYLRIRAAETGNAMHLFDAEEKNYGALSHYSFGQLCSLGGAPAGYLRSLPSALAQIPLQWSLQHAERADGKLLYTVGEETGVRAITSPTYGRVWDADVVDAVRNNIGPEWKVPAASYASCNPKLATTLYASDHDVFLFLVDDTHPIEVPGRNGTDTLYRGFYVGNSEVGAGTFFIATFLYRTVCDNRNIWGAQDFTELRIRHTSGAPQRFMKEAKPALTQYLEAGTASTVQAIQVAREKEVGKSPAEVRDWLKAQGFTQTLAKKAMDGAEEDGSNPRSVWGLVQGLTAAARDLEHTDDRIALEKKAGTLMKHAA